MSDKFKVQIEKGAAFHALHSTGQGFIIPNPWDAGTSRLLSLLGFPALATTSAGFAFSQAYPDNSMTRDQLLPHLKDIASAVSIPVTADLENGFGASTERVAETIKLAAETGVVGGSIEDTTGNSESPLFSIEFAAERIRAAAEAARALPFKFTLTARAENYAVGRADIADVIKRLQAYQDAGADVLYAPFITKPEEIALVAREVDRPINIMMGCAGMNLTAGELMEMGVRRISVGGSLARAAIGEFMRAAKELKEHGTAGYSAIAASAKELNGHFARSH